MLQTKKKLKKTEYKRLKKLLRHLSAEEQDEGFFFYFPFSISAASPLYSDVC